MVQLPSPTSLNYGTRWKVHDMQLPRVALAAPWLRGPVSADTPTPLLLLLPPPPPLLPLTAMAMAETLDMMLPLTRIVSPPVRSTTW